MKRLDNIPAWRAVQRFNSWLENVITSSLSSMWCAYVFACLALVSLPAAIRGGVAPLVAWTAQTFIQLVALSVLGAGQDKSARWVAVELRETHDAVLEELRILRAHLGAEVPPE